MQFKIGDEVTTKQIGFPGVGHVVGIVKPEVLQLQQFIKRWDEFYPGWQEKEIAYIKFKRPQRPINFEEWKDVTFPPEVVETIPSDDLELMYMNNVHYTKYVAVTVCDLEKFA